VPSIINLICNKLGFWFLVSGLGLLVFDNYLNRTVFYYFLLFRYSSGFGKYQFNHLIACPKPKTKDQKPKANDQRPYQQKFWIIFDFSPNFNNYLTDFQKTTIKN
jgi:hypothetical protein